MGWLRALFGGSRSESGGWVKSEAGNQTQIVGGSRVTIYADGALWKFCVADPDNQTAPYFSEGYHTADMARQESMSFIRGGPSLHRSHREMREEQQEASLPDRISDERGRQVALIKSVVRAEGAVAIKASRLANLKKNIRSRSRISGGIWVEAHSGERADLKRATDEIRDGYYELEDRVALIRPTCD